MPLNVAREKPLDSRKFYLMLFSPGDIILRLHNFMTNCHKIQSVLSLNSKIVDTAEVYNVV